MKIKIVAEIPPRTEGYTDLYRRSGLHPDAENAVREALEDEGLENITIEVIEP